MKMIRRIARAMHRKPVQPLATPQRYVGLRAPVVCNYADDYYGDRVCGVVDQVRRTGGC